MRIIQSDLDGLVMFEPKVHEDGRGFFLETFRDGFLEKLGIEENFVQENHSRSKKNVLRGMHFSAYRPQAQLVTVMHGRIYDVCIDLRGNSRTFGQSYGVELSDQGLRQIYMPAGFAHGFCVLSDLVDMHYKVTQFYDPKYEAGIVWDDPDLAIKWPISSPITSERDRAHPRLREINVREYVQY